MSENIIYHDFGGPMKKESKETTEAGESALIPEEEKAKQEEKVLALANLLSGGLIGKKLETFTNTLNKLREMREYITSLQIIEDTQTTVIRNDLVDGMTFEQMCNAVLESDKTKWQTHPSYYIALSRRFTQENFTKLINDALRGDFNDEK
jgi:hypothetical protein